MIKKSENQRNPKIKNQQKLVRPSGSHKGPSASLQGPSTTHLINLHSNNAPHLRWLVILNVTDDGIHDVHRRMNRLAIHSVEGVDRVDGGA